MGAPMAATNRFYMACAQNSQDITNATSTYIDATGLSIDVDPGDQLTFRFMVLVQQSNALDSIKLNLAIPADPVIMAYDMHLFDRASINAEIIGSVMPLANTPFVSWTQGYFENGPNSGKIQMQFAAVSGLGTATVLKNGNAVSWRVSP
jgi:hypothetical protein